MTNSPDIQAILAVRKRVSDTLAALVPAIPLVLENDRSDPASANAAAWVQESVVGGTDIVAELGRAGAAPLRERREQLQYMHRAAEDTGFLTLRAPLSAIATALRSQGLYLTDGVTPVVVEQTDITPLRPLDEHGRVSMALVITYSFTAL